MFVAYNPPQTETTPLRADAKEFLSGDAKPSGRIRMQVVAVVFVDRLTAHTDAGKTLSRLEDPAAYDAGLVEEAGRVTHDDLACPGPRPPDARGTR